MAKKSRVLVGLSGGIDSTVSAYMLQNEGYEVEGLYMILHANEEYHRQNIAKAKKVADFLGIKLHVADLQDRFDLKVFQPFVQTYAKGETPNPCVLCNRNLKFGEMIRFADEIGADFLATGHYVKCDGEFFYEAGDDSKDQSYFLFYVDRSVLPRLKFPLANYKKSEIKQMASKIMQLEEFATQKESSEICFVETTYTDVLREHVEVDQAGAVLDLKGNVVGEHKGYMHYTIGKRRGFSVHGAHDPHFVVGIDAKNNSIVVGKREDLLCHKVVLDDLNMFIDDVEFEASVKLRYRTKAVECSVSIRDGKAFVDLKEGVFGVAIGQAGVFYRDGKMLGGGWIVDNK